MGEVGLLAAPPWLIELVRQAKTKNDPTAHGSTRSQLVRYGLNTVCDGARCPNRGSCFSRGTATFMILGNICTRNCTFCAVSHGRPGKVDIEEPLRLKEAVKSMGLTHVVITSVTRDDLFDGGAGHFAAAIKELRTLKTSPSVEVLTPDFRGSLSSLEVVLEAGPEVFAHNVETVPRLYPVVCPGADYQQSLKLLDEAEKRAWPGTLVKSGFMLGMGEKPAEVKALMKDLRDAGVAMLTIGQYLAPSIRHYPVRRYVTPDEYNNWAGIARDMGFKSVASGALVRSSYHAGEYYLEVLASSADADMAAD